MKFISTLVFFLFTALVSAQNPNAFNIPPQGFLLTAGQSSTFTWSNLAGSTVTLQLRSGPSNNLDQGVTIASGLQNTGTFTFTVPSNLPQGNDYALEIIDEQDTSIINFTPQFTLISSFTSSSSAAPVTTSTTTVSLPSTSTVYSTVTAVNVTSTASAVLTTTLGTAASTGSFPTGSGNATAPSVGNPTTSAPFTVATGAAARPMAAGAGLLAVVAAFAAAL